MASVKLATLLIRVSNFLLSYNPWTQILILQTIAKPISGKIKEQARQCVFILPLVSSMVILTAKQRADMNVFEVFAWTLPNLCIAPKWDYEPTYLENLIGIYALYPKQSVLFYPFSPSNFRSSRTWLFQSDRKWCQHHSWRLPIFCCCSPHHRRIMAIFTKPIQTERQCRWSTGWTRHKSYRVVGSCR